ncbi:UNVERIFIED_CONTAM: hypothetical protein PYX00_006473 [Menopon gallinae]|uniref:Uncharacterized protein n=1 Tax=Menopon gallinae TaxID=328185 RepID=A0AAW2HXB8_9NEOP
MDKSPSINCQDVDDGSWDLDENNEEFLQELENLSSNSWDITSEKDNKDCNETPIQETTVEAFKQEDVDEFADSCQSSKVINALEIPVSSARESASSDSISEICLPEDGGKCVFDEVKKFEDNSGRSFHENVESEIDTVQEINDVEKTDKIGEVEGVELFTSAEKIEQSLVVEDLEEPENQLRITETITESDADDESVWKVPQSPRTVSTVDSIISSPVRTKVFIRKKSRSDPNISRRINRTKCSKSCGNLTVLENICLKDALIKYEGSCKQEIDENKKKHILKDIIELGDKPMYFQEIECRTLRTGTKDKKMENDDRKEDLERENRNLAARPGASNMSEEAVSLPDISGAGRSDRKENYEFRKAVSFITNQSADDCNDCNEIQDNNLSESWILLDEMGQSQRVTMLEVRFLLNGRSADSVLQENKEHFIPRSSVVRNANSDFLVEQWNPLVEESLQHFLHEEDPVGEEASNTIGLERKFGNMLLYIQSGVNLTSSVRFIPVDTEMIHMWRQSRENVSPISSEDDTRVHMTENIMEEASEFDNPETSEYMGGGNHGNHGVFKHGSAARKRRNKQNKTDDCEHRILENRKIIDSLTDNIKQLRTRLDVERSRSSSLEQEVFRLRAQLDKCKSGQSSTKSQISMSQVTEECKTNGIHMIPEITSSSLLSIEEIRNDNNESRADDSISQPRSKDQENAVRKTDKKRFKEALEKNLSDIEEILKCKNKSQAGGGKENSSKTESKKLHPNEDSSRVSSSGSGTTFATMETTSQALSETAGSVYSWFNSKKLYNSQRDIPEIITELEKEVGISKSKEHGYIVKDAILREELAEKSVSVENLRKVIMNIFQDVSESREKLNEMGVATPNFSTEIGRLKPDDLLVQLRNLMAQMTSKIADFQKENTILKKSIKENFTCHSKDTVFSLQRSFDVNFLQEVPGLLFNNIAKDEGSIKPEDAMLEEQIKNLRKENDVLLESHVESREKLKSTTISLIEEKSKVEALQAALKAITSEKSNTTQALEMCRKEKAILESDLEAERKKIIEMKIECERTKMHTRDLEEKIQGSSDKCREFDELKKNYKELESRESFQIAQLQCLTEELKKLDKLKSELEEELRAVNLEAEESSRGKLQYIQHLETMVSNAEQNLADIKHKYNEASKTALTLQEANEDLEKQNLNNIKMCNKANDELENCRGIIKDLEQRNKTLEEEKRKALCDLNTIVKSEREKTETLEKLINERKGLDEELTMMRSSANTQERAKDRLLKEQKDLRNEVAILKKQNAKLGLKYQNVKFECNERTRLLKRLDIKMKENFVEYNKRIACLEKNVCNIIEKAVAYKNSFQEKHSEVNAIVRELQEQLDVVNIEKRDLETEFYAAMKQLQKEMSEKKRLKKLTFKSEMENMKDPSDCSVNTANDEMESRLKKAEGDVADKQEKIRQLELSKEEERIHYEGIIAGLKTQISRDQVRLDVLLKNISCTEKNAQEPSADEASKVVALEQKVLELTEELDKKRKRTLELTEVIENNEQEMRRKADECDLFKQKVTQLKDEIRNMKEQFSKLQEFLSTVSKNVETYQKERDEIAGKLAKSLKVIMEERASKQSAEAVFAEKEKLFKSQIEELHERLGEKNKEYEEVLKTMGEKKSMVSKLQDDVKKWKLEVANLKAQVGSLTNEKRDCQDNEINNDAKLREMRELNLELRKREGELKAIIVRLEDDLRGARLLIKELEGDLMTEKNSKRLLKEVITSARQDIQKFRRNGQVLPSIADKIERHFNLSQVQSRELLSGYRTNTEENCLMLH